MSRCTRFLVACAGVALGCTSSNGGGSTPDVATTDAVGTADSGDTGSVVLFDTNGPGADIEETGEDTGEDTVHPAGDTTTDDVGGEDTQTTPDCATAGCPDGQVCAPTGDGTSACFTTGKVEEPFDTQTHKAPSTTALWGGGVLTVDSGTVGGNGEDGSFAPATDTVIDTTAKGSFNYTSYVIPKGVTVTVVGTLPYSVRALGHIEVAGTLRSNGAEGRHACSKPDGSGKPPGGIGLFGGAGGAGGGAGGDSGGLYGQNGQPGAGAGGGGGSTGSTDPSSLGVGGAGGGSFGSSGDPGTSFYASFHGAAGPLYGEATLPGQIVGGSGGGGGAGKDHGGNDGTCGGCPADTNCYQGQCKSTKTYDGDGVPNAWDVPGGSGGGGGGAISLSAVGNVTVRGLISVDGGNGGYGEFSGAGAGGSGGAIRLSSNAEVLLDGGALSALGGRGGLVTCSNQLAHVFAGKGGDGRIRIASASGLAQGFLSNPIPPPSFAAPTAELSGGSGKDGAFAPTEDVTLDADAGSYEYTSFVLPKGVTLRAKGASPLRIFSQGGIDLFGTVELSGESGGTGFSACCGNPYDTAHPGAGGQPGAGGFAGGDGGSASPGQSGEGPGAAPGGPGGSFSSAGGAGFAVAGGTGGSNDCATLGPAGGAAYGGESLESLVGGSGGGGAGDSNAAACTWCRDGACLAVGSLDATCPANPTCGGYCSIVNATCDDVVGCMATDRWNPGSGGGGGGGALHLEATGLIRLDGQIFLNGGHGGDSRGASEFNDGSCGPGCLKGCFEGVCEPLGGGSFGGSGGGGSGGALRVRAAGLRAEGLVEARGGGSGTLSQGGGCPVDPTAANPLPGQGRGGRGSQGRLRIETNTPTGSILIGDGTFSRDKTAPTYGTLAVSTWYTLPAIQSRIAALTALGLGAQDLLELSVAPSGPGGGVDEGAASPWESAPSLMPSGAYVRFRVQLAAPKNGTSPSVIDAVTIDALAPL